MKQKSNHRKPGGFLEGKGYYIALFLCVAAIGISGYFLFSGLGEQPEGFGPSSAVSGQAEMKKDASDSAGGQPEDKEGAAASEDEKKEDSQETGTETQTPEKKEPTKPDPEAAASLAYAWPVEGKVLRDFSLEVFAYDETMGDWRTHEGLDIAAEAGAPVAACAKGTVSEVRTDEMLGVMVVVDHGKGMESLYANLAEGVNVQVGTPVEAGTVLGTVGNTAISESADPSHLHFELIEYDVSIDPLNYLH
ncbi:MAG: peptidoglycan DD-metalloendopeptidase family protein [Evtepia sp.]|uniref:peptidoglycan DD-metalloendopeptidase family protein n=1 Tax=Evtepia sp. TaxID=2773933 RepID=UPI002A753B53|nr:peptidoglycan DD-metalloendopeptidase family protein [Evtepia sp.]MDY3014484.1 peptidoglycan DD-metalloendopeptidase family protein [Evtepia sp.]